MTSSTAKRLRKTAKVLLRLASLIDAGFHHDLDKAGARLRELNKMMKKPGLTREQQAQIAAEMQKMRAILSGIA